MTDGFKNMSQKEILIHNKQVLSEFVGKPEVHPDQKRLLLAIENIRILIDIYDWNENKRSFEVWDREKPDPNAWIDEVKGYGMP